MEQIGIFAFGVCFGALLGMVIARSCYESTMRRRKREEEEGG